MLLHQSPYLPTCKTEANERAFAAEEPSHAAGIIPFSAWPIIHCPQTRCRSSYPYQASKRQGTPQVLLKNVPRSPWVA